MSQQYIINYRAKIERFYWSYTSVPLHFFIAKKISENTEKGIDKLPSWVYNIVTRLGKATETMNENREGVTMKKIYRVSYYAERSAMVTTICETASLAEALKLIHQQPTTDGRHWNLAYMVNGKTAFICSPRPGSDRPLCPMGLDIEDIPTAMLADLIAVQTSYINGHADCDDQVIASRIDCIKQLGQRPNGKCVCG